MATGAYLKYGIGPGHQTNRGFWYRNDSLLSKDGVAYPVYAAAKNPHALFVLKDRAAEWPSEQRKRGNWGDTSFAKSKGVKSKAAAPSEYFHPWQQEHEARYGESAKPAKVVTPRITRCEFDGEVLRVEWNDASKATEWVLEYAPTWWPAAYETTVSSKSATLRFPDGGADALDGTVEVRIKGAAFSDWRLAGQPCAQPYSMPRVSQRFGDGVPKIRLADTTAANSSW